MSFEELKELALSKRGRLGLTFEYQDFPTLGESPVHVADSFVKSFGFKPIGTAWRCIERSEALDTVSRILFRDLAYQRPLMEQKTATYIAESFLNLFAQYGGRFCTNGSFDNRGMLSWTPITESTFDHGVVAFDDQKVGLVWVEDED